MDETRISRIAGLTLAIGLEFVRAWADQDRNKPSLEFIQRDAMNFSRYIHEGAWLVEVKRERPSQDDGVTLRTGRFPS